MLDNAVNDMAVEELVKKQFGLQVDIKQMVAREVPVSHTATANVFLTSKHQLFALIQAKSALTLGDVQRLAKRMGLRAAAFMPPNYDEAYFNDKAREKFRQVFPGRHSVSDDELRYYRTLVPYNPALIKIELVEDGTIRQFDSHDSSEWRVAAKFAYKQITAL